MTKNASLTQVLAAGFLQDLALAFFLSLLFWPATFLLKKDNTNLLYFKILLIFIFSLEFFLILAAFVDMAYFALGRSHLHYSLFSFAVYTSYFTASIISFFTWQNLAVLFFVVIIFLFTNFLIIKKINYQTFPNLKVRILFLILSVLFLSGLIFLIPKLEINDSFINDVSSNFFVYLVSTSDKGYCHRPDLIASLKEKYNFDQNKLSVDWLPPGFLHVDSRYPLIKAPKNDLCQLDLIKDLDCEKDQDRDGYTLKNDCNDDNNKIYPKAKETLNNGIDENCNGIDDGKPNIILIVLESFGAKYLSADLTPFFWQLAKDNLSFTNFYSNGTDTSRSIISGFCSVLPQTGPPEVYDSLKTNFLCLPNILQKYGYYNLEMQAGDLGFLNKKPFFEKIGFEQVLGKNDLAGDSTNAWGISDKQLFAQAAQKIESLPNQPFFLALYGLSVHHPFEMPKDGNQKYPHDTFTNKVYNLLNYTDQALAEFFEKNQDKDWFKNSIIIVTADNSQPLGERIFNYTDYVALYEENIWIPLVIVKNQSPKLSGLKDTVSSQIDLAPTILDLLGIQTINHFQGKSLINDQLNYQDSFMYATNPYLGCMSAYRQGDYKIMKRFYKDNNLFFDLKEDKLELNNLEPGKSTDYQQFDQKVSDLFLAQYSLYQNNSFWSDKFQSIFEQLVKSKQKN
ncbi:MAG: sulfatase-like hydrolase/transferase [Candidatus Buchananbacteria bacterium]